MVVHLTRAAGVMEAVLGSVRGSDGSCLPGTWIWSGYDSGVVSWGQQGGIPGYKMQFVDRWGNRSAGADGTGSETAVGLGGGWLTETATGGTAPTDGSAAGAEPDSHHQIAYTCEGEVACQEGLSEPRTVSQRKSCCIEMHPGQRCRRRC